MSWREINVNQLEELTNPLLIDVRSPCEHVSEFIPGSVNIPLLSDEERSVIGTIYAQKGEMVARREALRLITPKIPMIVDAILLLRNSGRPTVVHCWRGGLRSEAVASVLSIAGIDCFRLTGGYKAWRNYVLTRFKEDKFVFEPVVLDGLTGVGKTAILTELSKLGAQVLDLESLANHRGSVFGSLGLGSQPTQKNFEAKLWTKLKGFDQESVFLEAESRKIGNIAVPDCILKKIKSGRRVLVTGNLEVRRARILSEYMEKFDVESFTAATKYLEKLKERLSSKRCSELIELAENRQFEQLVDALLIEYYDPLYQRQIERSRPYEQEVSGDDAKAAAQAIYDRFHACCSAAQKESP